MKKAHDVIWLAGLWHGLLQLGVGARAVAALRVWHGGTEAAVLGDSRSRCSRPFRVLSGVRQGGALFPALYVLPVCDPVTAERDGRAS